MKNSFDIAKTTPLMEKPVKAADVAVNFTPVDVPTPRPGNLTGMLVANFSYAETPIKTLEFLCPHCGNQSGNTDLFCVSCGEFIDPDEPIKRVEEVAPPTIPACDDCGTPIILDDVFCMSCGSVVTL
ncbi:MAG: zinc ribbon domain-containing protein [Acidobacteria bacterium]|nr:zinc ribbon domain-containing protein [Acidobacteriota bacterium]